MSTLAYIKNLIKDRNVASVTPSSPFLVKRVCRKMDFSQPRVLVEFGPGTGVFTETFLERLTPDSRLILIELNGAFVETLQRRFGADPRVQVFHDSVTNVGHILREAEVPPVDYFVSGIPFSFLNRQEKNRVLSQSRDALAPDGRFLAYQHFDHLRGPLQRHFATVRTDNELLNIPPIVIYEAAK